MQQCNFTNGNTETERLGGVPGGHTASYWNFNQIAFHPSQPSLHSSPVSQLRQAVEMRTMW